VLGESSGIDTVLIGSEGGLSESERALLQKQKVVRLDTPMILRSETAATAIASKILL
jgi:16S rRNA (uracil1498-N3)-methyltransferase